MATTDPSFTTVDPDSKCWVCGKCHTPLVLAKDFDSKLNRDGLYSGFCLFKTTTNVLPGKILSDGTWTCRCLHCIWCSKRIGGKYLQVPVDHAAKEGKVFIKMANVCFFYGKSVLDAAAGFLECLLDSPMADMQADSAQWVQLNVGGKIFWTTIDTLTRQPGSVLALMFNGQYKLTKKNGCIMIDRDGTYFGHILNWLRDGFIPLLEPRMYPSLALEANFYNLVDLKNSIEEITLQCNADMNRKEVVNYVSAGKRNFKRLNLSGQDLSKLNLENADFSYARLQGVNFKGANLRSAILENCDAPDANFNGSDLRLGALTDGNFTRCSFVGAYLPADLIGADFTEADLSGADLTSTDICSVILNNVKLDKANLRKAKMSEENYRIALKGGATF